MPEAGYVLPRTDTAGLPVTTVNLDRVKLRLLRVNERNLVPSLDAEKFTMKFDSWDIDQVIKRTGKLVWEGEMAISGKRNTPVTTAIPLTEMLRDSDPGVYLAVVERADLRPDDIERPATNWVLVSDLGLTSYTGADAMVVAVRSLATATPVPGVAVRLYARNNGELANVTSDAGRPRPDPGRARARQRRRRAVCGHGVWQGRRFQFPRSRPSCLRSERSRRHRP